MVLASHHFYFIFSIFRLAVILIESCCLEKNCQFSILFSPPTSPPCDQYMYVDSVYGMGSFQQEIYKVSICEEREDTDNRRIDSSCTDYVCYGIQKKNNRHRKLDFTYQTVSTFWKTNIWAHFKVEDLKGFTVKYMGCSFLLMHFYLLFDWNFDFLLSPKNVIFNGSRPANFLPPASADQRFSDEMCVFSSKNSISF